MSIAYCCGTHSCKKKKKNWPSQNPPPNRHRPIIHPGNEFYVNNVYINKYTFLYLKNIAQLQPQLADKVAQQLIHSFISPRWDYCNGVLCRIPNKTLDRLQYVENFSARVFKCTRPPSPPPLFTSTSFQLSLVLTYKSLWPPLQTAEMAA